MQVFGYRDYINSNLIQHFFSRNVATDTQFVILQIRAVPDLFQLN